MPQTIRSLEWVSLCYLAKEESARAMGKNRGGFIMKKWLIVLLSIVCLVGCTRAVLADRVIIVPPRPPQVVIPQPPVVILEEDTIGPEVGPEIYYTGPYYIGGIPYWYYGGSFFYFDGMHYRWHHRCPANEYGRYHGYWRNGYHNHHNTWHSGRYHHPTKGIHHPPHQQHQQHNKPQQHQQHQQKSEPHGQDRK